MNEYAYRKFTYGETFFCKDLDNIIFRWSKFIFSLISVEITNNILSNFLDFFTIQIRIIDSGLLSQLSDSWFFKNVVIHDLIHDYPAKFEIRISGWFRDCWDLGNFLDILLLLVILSTLRSEFGLVWLPIFIFQTLWVLISLIFLLKVLGIILVLVFFLVIEILIIVLGIFIIFMEILVNLLKVIRLLLLVGVNYIEIDTLRIIKRFWLVNSLICIEKLIIICESRLTFSSELVYFVDIESSSSGWLFWEGVEKSMVELGGILGSICLFRCTSWDLANFMEVLFMFLFYVL